STALRTRTEMKESQALVAAACEAHRREKYAPYVPSVLVGFSHGGFGGGIGSTINNVDDRYDLDAVVTWELRNLGLGEHAAKCTNAARVEQAKFEKLRVMDEVSRQVSEALAQIQLSRSQISSAQLAIQSARDSHARNLDRIREGEGLPIESLQSVQALAATQRAYLDAVTKFNRAQLRLQWAMGWPSVP
ncbi:MAG: TolC family protein, partial [Planctomycetales bacterium]|nr:TolC family protein [Planctomycetales bacterium]